MGLLEDQTELHVLIENLRRDLNNARRTSSLIVSGFSTDKITKRMRTKLNAAIQDFEWIQGTLEAYQRWEKKEKPLSSKK